MKRIFYPEIDCPSYVAQKELGYEPNPNEIQNKSFSVSERSQYLQKK